ncbi:MAG TPA: hypothetical protein VKH64_01400 [Candidatus Binatia bacterium]|nr:hypothetical protein [Candidatus Binatia bacterium]
MIALLGVLCDVAADGRNSVAQSCARYLRLPDNTRTALAAGYLEGVQAGLKKESRDMLVPAEDPDHPIWWVLPEGEVSSENLDSALTAFCKYTAGKETSLADAFSGIAARKEGMPRTAPALPDGRSEMGRAILPESQLRCVNYLSTAESEKAHFIYGYSLGAKAITAALETPLAQSVTVRSDSDYRGVRAKVDAACKNTRYADQSIRDVLSRVAAEMGVAKGLASERR